MGDTLLEFICQRRCQYNGRIHPEGTVIKVLESQVKKCPKCEGKGCKKCADTGRRYPPHHFEPYNQAAEDLKMVAATAEDNEKKATLKAELKTLGKDTDPVWDVTRLEQEVARAKAMKSPSKTPFKPFTAKKDALEEAGKLKINTDDKSLKEINGLLKIEHDKE